ncbi:O-sialoglycoprotein endopeptidase, partial [bacterium]
MSLILGIDTSCYTTSAALVDTAGNLVADARQLLDVGAGERGLQQSAAVFQHIRNLPGLIAKLSLRDRHDSVTLVAASTRPRPVEGSYMPVFMVGESYARTVAEAVGASFMVTSHQEGHLMAGLWSAGGPEKNKFLAVHLSGGTSELLLVERTGTTFNIEKLGGT